MIRKICFNGILCIISYLLMIQQAYAYIDPGTGSKYLQIIIASVVTIGISLKIFWHKLLNLLGIRKDKDSDKH